MTQRALPISILILFISAIWIVFDQHGAINNDGVLYLQQAHLFALGETQQAMQLYPWPFFSYFIAQLHQLSSLTLQNAAQLINVLAFVIASYFFLKTLLLISQEKLVLPAGLLVLLTSIPIMDDYLPMLLRDNGMWAGLTAGIYFYLRWLQTPLVKHALLFQLCLIVGALFRPELFVFNLIIPLASIWLKPHTLNKSQAFFLSGLLIMMGFIVAIFALGYLALSGQLAQLHTGRLMEIYQRPLAMMSELLSPLPMQIQANEYLKLLIDQHALGLKYTFILYVIFAKWLSTVGLLHLSTAYLAIRQRLLDATFIKPLGLLFAVSFAITAINLPVHYILTSRYWVMNLWVVYVISALGLAWLLRALYAGQWRNRRWAKLALILVLIGHMLVVLLDSHRSNPDQQVQNWIKQQGVAIDQLYIDNPRLCFYLGRFDCAAIGLDGAIKQQYPYLILHFYRYQDYQEIAGYEIVEKFPHRKKKPSFVIYRRLSSDHHD